jgi:LysR family transcriptional regulator, benzoate and cis,cis-muconate-responsive activator of ben and cat genes
MAPTVCRAGREEKQPAIVTSQSGAVPELRHIRYAVAVAEELNFTRAAAREGVSQQVLSAQIRQLEEELGVRLFDRSTRQVRVTEAGAAVAERGQALLRDVEGLWEDVRRHGTGQAGVVRLGFWRSAAFATAPRLVAAMAEAHPDVRIEVTELPSPDLPQALRDGRIDVGLARWTTNTEGLFVQELGRHASGIVLRADDPLADRAELELGELADRTLLLHQRAALPARYDAVLAACAAAGFTPRIVTPRLPFDPTFADVAEGRAVLPASASVRASLPLGLRWIPFAGDVLEERIDVMWSPAHAAPARDAFLRVARALPWPALAPTTSATKPDDGEAPEPE